MNLRTFASAVLLLVPAGSLSAADPQLLGMVMPEAKVVAGVHFEQARATPFGQFLLGLAQHDNDGLSKFVAITGFDPRRDLTEVVFASTSDSSHKSGIAIARGRFDINRLIAAARADGQNVETYNGVEMTTGKNGRESIAFLDSTLALAGGTSDVRAAIDRRNRPTAFHAAIAVKIAQLGASQDAWVLSLGPVTGFNPGLRDKNLSGAFNGDLAKSIEQASAGVKFGAMVQVTAEAIARTEKDATALADVARFLASMAQLNMPEKDAAKFGLVLQSLDVQAQANTVKLSLTIPEDQLEKVIGSRHGARVASRRRVR